MFTTLFGDRTPGENEDPSEVFGNMWSDYGFRISNENTSLVSIVIYDPDFNQTFTGHTGVLIKQAEDIYLYVEKLAFEQPYQAILVSDTDHLQVTGRQGRILWQRRRSQPIYIREWRLHR